MSHPELDRNRLRLAPLAERPNKVRIERDCVPAGAEAPALPAAAAAIVDEAAGRVAAARAAGRPVVLAFGAHTIKNGLAPVLIDLLERGWVTHLATNGAGVIHDWEFAFQGASSEDVRANVRDGRFGLWEETGFHINLALAVGAYEGRGYGESVGALIERQGLVLPPAADLEARRDGAAADLRELLVRFRLAPGRRDVPHPWKRFSVQAAAFRLGVPFTGHPMFGHDIIYCHPLNCGAAVGRTAERDFLRFAATIAGIDGGVYLSVGSAVMSPMIFEKAFSMAQNLALQEGRRIEKHYILVADLAPGGWDWSAGEPPADHPAYYHRFCKTFSRMGGAMRYLSLDNRDFLTALRARLAT